MGRSSLFHGSSFPEFRKTSSSRLKFAAQISKRPSLLKSPHAAPFDKESDSSSNSTAVFVKIPLSKLIYELIVVPSCDTIDIIKVKVYHIIS